MRYPKWTADEEMYLREQWGCAKGGVNSIAQALGRTGNAVKQRAYDLGLGKWFDAGEYITLNQLHKVFSYGNNNAYYYTRFREMGLPVVKRWRHHVQLEVVRICDFWPWAEQHQNELDFSRLEENIFGLEPDWVKEKRKRDFANRNLVLPKKTPWGPQEDALLRFKCENGESWPEIEKAFMRSNPSIRRRIYDLNLPKPKRAAQKQWTPEELDAVMRMKREGYSIDYMAKALGRTGNSIRGKTEFLERGRGGKHGSRTGNKD